MNNASHLTDSKDTICALATPPGLSAIAVIRISGKEAFKVCEQIFEPMNKNIQAFENRYPHDSSWVDQKQMMKFLTKCW